MTFEILKDYSESEEVTRFSISDLISDKSLWVRNMCEHISYFRNEFPMPNFVEVRSAYVVAFRMVDKSKKPTIGVEGDCRIERIGLFFPKGNRAGRYK